MFDTTKSLEQLENDKWAKPDYDSYLVNTVHRLRQKPLKDFSVEDLRIMIGQQIGLEYLIPLAIKVLEDNPYAEGDYYPGDLLKNVLAVNPRFWNDHPRFLKEMERVISLTQTLLSQIDQQTRQVVQDALSRFNGQAGS